MPRGMQIETAEFQALKLGGVQTGENENSNSCFVAEIDE